METGSKLFERLQIHALPVQKLMAA